MKLSVFFLFFIFFLLLENLFLSALVGFRPFLITPLFLLGAGLHIREFKFKSAIFLVLAALFSGTNAITTTLSFLITFGIYSAIGYFLNIESDSSEVLSFFSIIRKSLTLLILGLIYFWFFIFLESAYDLYLTSNRWLILVETSGLYFFIWSVVLSILLIYVSKKE